jgi:hypothetical protein
MNEALTDEINALRAKIGDLVRDAPVEAVPFALIASQSIYPLLPG